MIAHLIPDSNTWDMIITKSPQMNSRLELNARKCVSDFVFIHSHAGDIVLVNCHSHCDERPNHSYVPKNQFRLDFHPNFFFL